ncbi:MAG: hypothetical protein M1835_004052, partial [Candelina submexicana]
MQSPNMHTPSTAHTPSTTALSNNGSIMQTPSTTRTPSVMELINDPGYEGYEAATSPGIFPALSGPHEPQQGSRGSADAGVPLVSNLPRSIDGLGSSGVISSALRPNDVPNNGLEFNGPLGDGLPPVDGLLFDDLLHDGQPFDGPSSTPNAAAPANLNNPIRSPPKINPLGTLGRCHCPVIGYERGTTTGGGGGVGGSGFARSDKLREHLRR